MAYVAPKLKCQSFSWERDALDKNSACVVLTGVNEELREVIRRIAEASMDSLGGLPPYHIKVSAIVPGSMCGLSGILPAGVQVRVGDVNAVVTKVEPA